MHMTPHTPTLSRTPRLGLTRSLLLTIGVSLASLGAFSTVSTGAPDIGVFPANNDGTGKTKTDQYAAWVGRDMNYIVQFYSGASWDEIDGTASSGLNWWSNQWVNHPQSYKDKLVISIPLLPTPVNGSSLATGATGAYNQRWINAATKLVSRGMGNATLRLGWEFNGNWYTWNAREGRATHFKNYWIQIVNSMRSVPGQNFKFCWNPSMGDFGMNPMDAYPGAAYVDSIGLDLYDIYSGYSTKDSNGNMYPNLPGWQVTNIRNNGWLSHKEWGAYPLDWWAARAAERGKPLCFPEWGLDNPNAATKLTVGYGGQDNTIFLTKFNQWINNPANNVAWHAYFEAGGGTASRNHQIFFSNQYPNAKALFPTLFGGGSGGPEIIVDNTGSTGVTLTGSWTASTFNAGYYGSDYLHDGNTGKGAKSVRFTPTIPTTGSYDVFMLWTSGTNRATNVPVDIVSASGTTTLSVDQTVDGGQWVPLGLFNFNAGTAGSVLIRTTGTNGYVIADAVGFVGATAPAIASPAKIINSQTSKSLRPYNAGTGDNVNIVQYTYNSTWTSEHWTITDLGNNYYSIRNVYTGKSLRPLNASTIAGANIIQYTYDSTWQSEQWELIPEGAGYYGIRNRYSGLALRPVNAGTGNDVQIVQEPYNASDASMKWLIAAP